MNVFLLERLEGRHGSPNDLAACRPALLRSYALSISHGALDMHKFLILSGFELYCFVLERQTGVGTRGATQQRTRHLERQLRHESGRGGTFTLVLWTMAERSQIYRRVGGCSDRLLEQARRG